MFAQGEESAAFGLLVRREFFPLRTADGAEQDGVAGFTGGDGFSGESLAHGVDGSTANELVVVFKGEAGTGGDGVEDFERLGHDFRADAVSGEDCEFERAGHVRGGKGGGF
jgi:hypothetical protein